MERITAIVPASWRKYEVRYIWPSMIRISPGYRFLSALAEQHHIGAKINELRALCACQEAAQAEQDVSEPSKDELYG